MSKISIGLRMRSYLMNKSATRGFHTIGKKTPSVMESSRSEGQIIIPCQDTLIEKFRAIKRDGPSNLHLLTDYDQTLTKALFSDGSPCDSSFKTIIDYRGTPEAVRKETTELYKKYYPIEKDLTIPAEEKL